MTQPSPFKWFRTSPEIIRPAVMFYIRFPLSLRTVGDLLHECGVEIGPGTRIEGRACPALIALQSALPLRRPHLLKEPVPLQF